MHPCRMDIVVRYLLDKNPGADVVLLSLFPRGFGSHLQPSIFTGAINKVNAGYR